MATQSVQFQPSSSHLTRRSSSQIPSFCSWLLITQVPLPCRLSFFHYPMYLRPSGQVYVPCPYFLSFLQLPQYRLPSDHVYTPCPCFLLSCHSPSYFFPSGHSQIPKPSILPLTQLPLQTSPVAQKQVPSPFLLPCLNIPQYLFPSLQISTPEPCCISFYQYPQQRAPVLLWRQVPQPLALSSLHQPSQQSPLVCVNLPLPWALLLSHSPSQTAPSGHFWRPWPSRILPNHQPSYSMPFLNLIMGFFSLVTALLQSSILLSNSQASGWLPVSLLRSSFRLNYLFTLNTSLSSSSCARLRCSSGFACTSSSSFTGLISAQPCLFLKDSGMLSHMFWHEELPIFLNQQLQKRAIRRQKD